MTRFEISSELAEAHAWKAVKLPSGDFLVATGYQADLQVFDPCGRRIASVRGPEDSRPWFYCYFRELPEGKMLVVNWQGHGPGHGDEGEQLLVFSDGGDGGAGEWSYLGGWRPGAAGGFSSIQAALPIFLVSDLPS
jgi:hypothetical protein